MTTLTSNPKVWSVSWAGRYDNGTLIEELDCRLQSSVHPLMVELAEYERLQRENELQWQNIQNLLAENEKLHAHAHETSEDDRVFAQRWRDLLVSINADRCRWPGLRNELLEWLRCKLADSRSEKADEPRLATDEIRDLACCDTFVRESANELCATCGYTNLDHLRKRSSQGK